MSQPHRQPDTKAWPRASSRAQGFTLLELLVTMAIVAIMALVAVPNLQTAISNSQQSSCLNDVVTMLNLARSEAVTRQTDVVACASTDQTTCDVKAFEKGWLVYIDDGGTGGIANDLFRHSSETLLRIGDPSCGSGTIVGTGFTATGTDVVHAVSFSDDGLVVSPGTFTICKDETDSEAVAVVVNISGQPRLATDASGGDGTVEDHAGNAVICGSKDT